MLKHLLPLIPAGLLVRQILPAPDGLVIVAAFRDRVAACPDCGAPSAVVHSRYERRLQDLPWQGRPVTLRIQARRLRCRNQECRRQTFVERLAESAAGGARRTLRLADLQRHLGLALGGEAGARLAARLAIAISADTLIRMARRQSPPPEPSPPPRVLGVDDWAWRRGHRYGSILVDLERNQVVDLLPDRQAETLSHWLRQHPGVEVVARDRACTYADGARQGAPGAVQVADRWHLLRNLGDAVQAVVERHHAAIRRIGREVAAGCAIRAAAAVPTETRPSAAQQRREAGRRRRQARYEEAARMHTAGVSISDMSRQLGADRKTLRRWLQAGAAPSWPRIPRGSILDRHRTTLEQRWAEGCHNALRLWRELASAGFPGRPSTVRAWATERRRRDPAASLPGAARGQIWQPPTLRRTTRLLMADGELPSDADRTFTARLLEVPALQTTVAVAKRIARLLRRKGDDRLEEALDEAAASPLASFAVELRKDIAAVRAALDLPWTTSPVEGQINRLKMIKRTMYGRAGFELLRARILQAA
ncbi:ISL3 family transposase [Pseudoroseomonas ludipueritiae]|uniref:ISL3 family transposase n=1 Tax=Pseudoroseomonas ludipueritiae TaxID=198093 RepID=UPI001EEE437E|nr:ISL3 family transposase [Pseudoroseomonas ludipueritiae]